MDVPARLTQNLRRLRQARELSQKGFADAAGIHQTYISDLERDARNPTIAVVEKLARALNVRVGELLD